jgi:acyl-CoA synthetase (AMP-forming)/AMP-acid ligase II
MLSHGNLMTSAMGCTATGEFVSAGGSYLHAAPMFHAADQAGGFGAALVGATHVIVPGFDPKLVLEAIAVHHVTDALLVPTMIQVLVDFRPAQYDVGNSGTSPRVRPSRRQCSSGPGRTLPDGGSAGYGMTELSPVTTLLRFADREGARTGRPGVRGTASAHPRPDDHGAAGRLESAVRGHGCRLLESPEETAAAVARG